MGTQAFTDFLTSIRDHIDTMDTAVGVLEMSVARLTTWP